MRVVGTADAFDTASSEQGILCTLPEFQSTVARRGWLTRNISGIQRHARKKLQPHWAQLMWRWGRAMKAQSLTSWFSLRPVVPWLEGAALGDTGPGSAPFEGVPLRIILQNDPAQRPKVVPAVRPSAQATWMAPDRPRGAGSLRRFAWGLRAFSFCHWQGRQTSCFRIRKVRIVPDGGLAERVDVS